jgi:hypothetical protein
MTRRRGFNFNYKIPPNLSVDFMLSVCIFVPLFFCVSPSKPGKRHCLCQTCQNIADCTWKCRQNHEFTLSKVWFMDGPQRFLQALQWRGGFSIFYLFVFQPNLIKKTSKTTEYVYVIKYQLYWQCLSPTYMMYGQVANLLHFQAKIRHIPWFIQATKSSTPTFAPGA